MSATVAVILTCFNRREKTLECLRRLAAQEIPPDIRMEVTLVDDGSTDGTSEAVRKEFPETTLVSGDGSLFWCGGMRRAWSAAALKDPNYFLLANDDTLLDPQALGRLIEIAGAPDSRRIAVAAIRDPASGKRTYGGVRGENTAVEMSDHVEECETFNANAVLVPAAVYAELGVFHHAYTHGMGDFDYGYLASRSGIKVLQSAELLGTCPRNPSTGTWRDTSLSRKERFRRLQSPKGLPWREWTAYNRRNAGWIWPWRSISPILRILAGK